MEKNFTIALAFVLMLCSCQHAEEQTTLVEYINDKDFPADITSSYTIVNLKDDIIEGLINDIKITKIMTDDNLIFISHEPNDNESSEIISVFDFDGNYLYNIGYKGRASYEYLRINDWYINIKENEVLIFDTSKGRILIYSYDGKYKSSISLKEKYYYGNGITYNGGHLYVKSSIPNGFADNIASLKNDGTYIELYPKREFNSEEFDFAPIKQYTSPENDTIYYIRPIDNNLYKIINSKVITSQTLDFINSPLNKKSKLSITSYSDYAMLTPVCCYDTEKYYIVVTIMDGTFVLSKQTMKWSCYNGYNATHSILSSILHCDGVTGNMLIGKVSKSHALHELKYNKQLSDREREEYDLITKTENVSLIFCNLK
jgi:hypothetical protein